MAHARDASSRWFGAAAAAVVLFSFSAVACAASDPFGTDDWTGDGLLESEGAVAEAPMPAEPAAGNASSASVIGDVSEARQLVFSGEMGAIADDIAVAADEITTWVGTRGGFVERSSTSSYGGRPSVHLVLRIPSTDYEALRDHVRDVVIEVQADESRREDVTSEHTDYRARLDALRLAETELRELLEAQDEQGGDLETVLAIHRELRTLRAEIDSLQAQLDGLEERVALSTLTVDLSGESTAATATRTWRIGAVFDSARRDLVRNLQVFSEGFVYFVVAVLPLALAWTAALGAAVWLVVTIARRLGRPRGAPRPGQQRGEGGRKGRGTGPDEGSDAGREQDRES